MDQPPSIGSVAPVMSCPAGLHRKTAIAPTAFHGDKAPGRLPRRQIVAGRLVDGAAFAGRDRCDFTLDRRRRQRARAQRVAGDAARRRLDRDRAGHAEDGGLRGHVVDSVGDGAARINRGHVDDAAPAARLHRRARRGGSGETGADRLTASASSHCSGANVSTGAKCRTTALFTRISMAPSAAEQFAPSWLRSMNAATDRRPRSRPRRRNGSEGDR